MGGLQGARFAKWRSVISIPAGPSPFALQDCAYGLARYAAIAQVHTHSSLSSHLCDTAGGLHTQRWQSVFLLQCGCPICASRKYHASTQGPPPNGACLACAVWAGLRLMRGGC